MNHKNTTLAIVLPLLLAIVFIGGFYLGGFTSGGSNEPIFIQGNTTKLNLLLNLIEEEYVDEVEKNNLIEDIIPLALKQLDPHSIYIPARDYEEVNAPLRGNFEGIGVQFNIQNDTVLIVRTIPGGPSEKVGILPGDRIITINDSAFAGQSIENDDVINKLKGEKGTTVTVGIERRGIDGLLEFEIIRDEIPLTSLDVAYMMNNTTGYIRINKFSRTTYDEFMQAANDLHASGMEKVVIDLRSNSGGYLEMATEIADEFLRSEQLIVYTQGKARPRRNYFATRKGNCHNDEVVVLLDTWSASASEILAGAIQDNDRGIIVGQRSFGKGLVQETTQFSDGSAVRLTIARYYTPTGRCIQKPYQDGMDDYIMDIQNRYLHGEMEHPDSIEHPDSLKYTTPGGRTVYGGGGIMPDIFVPMDTTKWSQYYSDVLNRGLIYQFSLAYSDNNREKLNHFKNYENLINYLDSQNILDRFIEYTTGNNITPPTNEALNASAVAIENRIYAYISRNIIGEEPFYRIINQHDPVVQKAIDAFGIDSLQVWLQPPGK